MLEDNEIEDIGTVAAKAYMDSTDEESFLKIMRDSRFYNVPTYIFKHHYAAISAFDMN